MTFECQSASGCVKERFGLKGECHAARLLNPRLCKLGDPKSDIYNSDYEEYLKETPKKEDVRALTPVPAESKEGYTPGIMQKIIDCPHRSTFKMVMDENNVAVRKHVFRDDTEAEGCGCSNMRCRLGKGDDGSVSEKDCKSCIDEQDSVVTPGLLKKAASLTTAVLKHVSSGLPGISNEAKERRFSICSGCVHNKEGNCKVCGCVLSVKIALPNERCPLNPPKWDVENTKAGE